MFRESVVVAAALLALVPVAATSARADVAVPGVITVAGNGRAGIADGAARDAEFLMPSALAFDAQGALYIADQSAQRIRKLANGRVSTVAGSGSLGPSGLAVDGGYRDGPALQARFSEPSGIAVAADGTIYVADMLNHSIRRIKNGVVSTYAGSPDRVAWTDGPLATASFRYPRALALDPDGTLFVADLRSGIRMISPDGTVSSLPIITPGAAFLGVAVWGSGPSRVVFAVDGTTLHVFRNGKDDVVSGGEEGDQPYPHPYAIAPLDDLTLICADIRQQVIRMCRNPDKPNMTSFFAEPIAGQPSESLAGAGFADGPATQAKFYSPRGVATFRNTVYVADAGNRRIRAFPAPDRRRPVGSRINELSPDPSHYRIAYVYSSAGFWQVDWPNSIEGILESKLAGDAARIGLPKPPRVSAVRVDGAGFAMLADYIKTYLGDGQVDLVILAMHPEGTNDAAAAGMASEMRALKASLGTSGEKLYVHLVTWFDSTAPVEFIEGRETNQAEPGWFDIAARVANVRRFERALAASGVPFCSSFDDVLAYERRADRKPLYGVVDYHMLPAAARLFAESLARHVEAAPPWTAR